MKIEDKIIKSKDIFIPTCTIFYKNDEETIDITYKVLDGYLYFNDRKILIPDIQDGETLEDFVNDFIPDFHDDLLSDDFQILPLSVLVDEMIKYLIYRDMEVIKLLDGTIFTVTEKETSFLFPNGRKHLCSRKKHYYDTLSIITIAKKMSKIWY